MQGSIRSLILSQIMCHGVGRGNSAICIPNAVYMAQRLSSYSRPDRKSAKKTVSV
jgi:hypothetical protein